MNENDDVKKLTEKVDCDFALFRAHLVIEQKALDSLKSAEMLCRSLAIRDFFQSEAGRTEIEALPTGTILLLLAENDLYRNLCNRLPETGYAGAVGQAFSSYVAMAGM